MRILLGYADDGRGNTTVKCPLLTKPTDQDDGCTYNNWAYAIIAIVAFIIVGIPFIAFICCLQKKIRDRQSIRRLNERSSPYPYQPITSEGSAPPSYGATDSADECVIRSPSHDSVSTASLVDKQNQQQDTTSVASSRASMVPAYDDVSLNQRSAAASRSRHSSNSESTRDGTKNLIGGSANLRRSSRLSSDSQDRFVDQPGQFYESVDVVTNLPRHRDQPKVRNDKQPPKKPPRQLSNEAITPETEDHVYSEVEGIESSSAFQSPSNEVVYEISPKDHGAVEGGSPVYAVLEPSPEVPDQNEGPESLGEQKPGLMQDEKATDDEVVDDFSSDKYVTILPPTPPEQVNEPINEISDLAASGSHEFDQYSVTPKEEEPSPMKSRSYFEEFLLGKVRALPADKRNGVFLIRDSTSSTGLKVLTLYCWKSDSDKELYHFKITFSEDGCVYLNKSSKRFSNLEELLKDLGEDKDMLPCVLTEQVFP
ncbi:uncharacterized protein LOC111336426 [Stylophora pistillata]|nr:uncharacterized protein LOC111336426 [Stylophora pistillata]